MLPQQRPGPGQGAPLSLDASPLRCSEGKLMDRATWHSRSFLVFSQIKPSNNGMREKNTTNGFLQYLWHLPREQCNLSLKPIFIHAYKYINCMFLMLLNGSKNTKLPWAEESLRDSTFPRGCWVPGTGLLPLEAQGGRGCPQDPSWLGRQSSRGTEVVCSVSTDAQQDDDPQVAC